MKKVATIGVECNKTIRRENEKTILDKLKAVKEENKKKSQQDK